MNNQQSGDTPSEWFEEWFNTDWYALLYNQRNEAEAQAFVARILNALKPTADARILDLACGKGRLALQLAELGYEVVGLDIAPDAIAHARNLAVRNVQFFTHDMRLPFEQGKFDLIFNFFTSFGYFDSDAEHVQTLKNVKAALQPDGLFVLDFLNTVYVRNNLVPHNKRNIHVWQFEMHRRFEEGYFIKDISVSNAGSMHLFQEKVRGFTYDEFEQLFEQAGLTIIRSYGDYELHPFDETHSPRLILVAKAM